MREKILFQEICSLLKHMLRVSTKKPSFLLKNIYTQSMISSCSENSKQAWWSHFNI